jgi:NADPH-dependent glutamate synthase beta subunit-like oxidoreductase
MAMESESYTINLDCLIPAIGQIPDLSWMRGGELETTRSRTFVVNPALGTSRTGVFAAGDAVTGPATIVQAVAQGNLVAEAVHDWIVSGALRKPKLPMSRHDMPLAHNMDEYASAHRATMPRLPLPEREMNFREVELGLDEKTARDESRRCLRCDLEWLDLMGIQRPIPVASEKQEVGR